MRIGVTFPQKEIGSDPIAIRDFAQAVEEMGYDHLLIYDHVLGASTTTRPNWDGPYNSETQFHEPFVLYGYLAAVTQRIELVTGVIILPQRQTALVAKQAAEVDILSGGRLRLGIGIGWNAVEYESLNENFHNRGARSDEQIQVLRALWSDTAITFRGRWHTINNAGINPLPPRRTIPIWIAGHADAVLRRTGLLADGWMPLRAPDDAMRTMIEQIHTAAREAGRDPQSIGIEGPLHLGKVPESGWIERVEAWRTLGATHIIVNTMDMGLRSPQEHIDTLRRARAILPSN